MLNKLLICCFVLSVLLLFSACGKSDTQHPTSNIQHQSDTSISSNPHPPSPNLVFNGDFEQGDTYPEGWTTKNQYLNDVTGWDTEVTHNSTHSLKIENIGGTDAYWQGNPIVFDTPAQAFSASVWTKAKDIKDNKEKYQIAFDVYLKGNDGKEIKESVFAITLQNNNEWQDVSGKFVFSADISKVVPYLRFSGTTGTAWFDDFSINAIQVDWSNAKILFDSNKGGTLTGKFEKAEDNSFVFKGPQTVFSTDFIPVDTNNIYKLSGEFRSIGSKESNLYFGFAPYTENKTFISHASAVYVQDTETELVEDCKKTDKILYVKNNLNWQIGVNYCVAFNVDDSNHYKDLPNFNLSSCGVDEIEKQGQFYKITLKKEVGLDFSSGTKIREHKTGYSYVYALASNLLIPQKWITLQGIINNLFYPGTKYIKILILANYGNSNESSLSISNIKLEELQTK